MDGIGKLVVSSCCSGSYSLTGARNGALDLATNRTLSRSNRGESKFTDNKDLKNNNNTDGGWPSATLWT